MYNKDKPVPFMIFATQRTGSNWLMGMLDAHPAVAAYDELLLEGVSGSGYWGRTDREFFEPYYLRQRKHTDRLTRAVWSFRYLDKLYNQQLGTEAIGMKLMYDQLWRNPWIWIYMIHHRIRVVHIARRNLLDIIISLETSKARKQPHALEGQEIETPTIVLNPQTVVSTLKTLAFRVQTARRLLTLLPVQSIEIEYEQLVAYPRLLEDVFCFLGVETQPKLDTSPSSRFKKLNTVSKSDLILNYDEISHALKATPFERFLEE